MRDDPTVTITIQPDLRRRLEAIARSYRSSLANLIDTVLNSFCETEESKKRGVR